jgi:CubicO group peptidase (beta-lactamase class C family)
MHKLIKVVAISALLAQAACDGEVQSFDFGAPPAAAPAGGSAPPKPEAPLAAYTPGAVNVTEAVNHAITNGARAVVILQNGVRVGEAYGGIGRIGRGEALASGTKSFTCALQAAARADGIIPSLETRVSSVIAPWGLNGNAPNNLMKNQIDYGNLLSMTGGLADDGASGRDLNSVNTYLQSIYVASERLPDFAIIYGPNSFQAFGAAFELATGGVLGPDGVTGGADPLNYLQQRIFTPIGIAPTDWKRDIAGKPNFGGGASFTARSWATYGQFILQNGRWNNVAIVPESAIADCSRYENSGFRGYGLGFWLNRDVGTTYNASYDSTPWPAEVETRFAAGGRIAPDVPESMFMAYGAGNAKMYVLPSHNIVAVKIGGSRDDNTFLGILIGTVSPP